MADTIINHNDYKVEGGRTVLPRAYDDDHGGRPGMERQPGGDLLLGPPIDDPEMLEKQTVKLANRTQDHKIKAGDSGRVRTRLGGRLVGPAPRKLNTPEEAAQRQIKRLGRRRKTNKSATSLKQARSQEVLDKAAHERKLASPPPPPSAANIIIDNTHVHQPTTTEEIQTCEDVGGTPEPANTKDLLEAILGRFDQLGYRISDLEDKFGEEDCDIAPERIDLEPPISAHEHTREAELKSPGPAATYTNVALVGTFGRFRSKAADVLFCDTHITLVYTGLPGDEDLLFEPPMGVTFELKVETGSDDMQEWKTMHVQHHNLITKLRDGTVIVVFPKDATPATPNEDVNLAQEERGL